MQTQNVFFPLVKHELKWRRNVKKNRRRMPRPWRLTYAAFFLLLVVGLTSFANLRGTVHFQGSWYFTWGLPFMIFGISINLINREWQNDTVGWWLSLPYKRSQLVFSKLAAGLIRGLILSLIIFVLVGLFTLYIMFLNGSLYNHFVGGFLLPGIKWFLLLVGISPFAASAGTFMGILAHTKARPALPLMWFLFWAMFPIAGMTGITSRIFHESNIAFPFSSTVVIPILISWFVAFIMLRVSAYLLERHLTL